MVGLSAGVNQCLARMIKSEAIIVVVVVLFFRSDLSERLHAPKLKS